MGVSSYLIPIAVLLSLKFSPVQSQQFASDFCANNFAIYENKIIRTEDSKKLGAKYLTSKDLTSRRECLKLCCLTNMCDVFIFEEKIPGTCYLFSCGPPDDFRCQFTSHGNYTSAVLSKSQPGRLEEEIRFNQHETELTRLREPMENSMKEMEMIPSPPSHSTSTTTLPPPSASVQTEVQPAASTQRTMCSRYQFECHTSKECIAIYNVCDGIPQCTDGSDEATELACPTTALRSTSSTTSHRDVPLHNDELLPDMSLTPQPPAFARMMPPPQKLLSLEEQAAQAQQQHMNPMIMHNQQSLQWPMNSQIQYNKELSGAYIDPNSGIMYRPSEYNMREGERQQQHMNYHTNSNGMMTANNRILPHKSNVPNIQSPDYPSMDTGMMNSNNNNNNVQYKMNQNLSPYSFVPAYQHVAPMQHNPISGLNNMDVASAHQLNYMRPVEYYYDDTTHQQVQALPQPRTDVVMEHDPPSAPVLQISSSSVKKQDTPVSAISSVDVTTTSTVHPPHRRKDKHARKQQMSAEILIKESVSEQYESFYPSSAIIVFTCGLFLTVTLAILLCCRLKMIRRRLRKGGKSAYAHDADFLVNGMYL